MISSKFQICGIDWNAIKFSTKATLKKQLISEEQNFSFNKK